VGGCVFRVDNLLKKKWGKHCQLERKKKLLILIESITWFAG
jgi:hypothetical protein